MLSPGPVIAVHILFPHASLCRSAFIHDVHFLLWLPSIFLCLHYWYCNCSSTGAAAVSFQFCKIWGNLNDWRHICTNVSFPRSLRFSQSWLGVLWIPAHMRSGGSVYVSILTLLSFWTFPPVLSAWICCHMWTLIVFCSERWWEKGSKEMKEQWKYVSHGKAR